MADNISDNEFKLLSGFIEELCGIHLEAEKMYLIETRLTKLMALVGCENYGQFYAHLKSSTDPALRDKIVDAITTNETFWFRDTHPYAIFREVMLPEVVTELRAGRIDKVRIWSAASSTGQEPYSLAMSVHEYCRANPGIRPDQFEIVATDVSPAALAIARAGRYDAITISRGMPDELKERYFKQDGRVWQLNPEVASLVSYRRFNLMDSMILLGRFDIVFMRYVLIYFAPELKRAILANAAGITRGKGFLVIGGTESLRGFCELYAQHFHAGGSYYRKCEG